MRFLKRFLQARQGVTAIEYSLMAAFIALVIVGAASALGIQLSTLYSTVALSFPR